MDYSNLSTVIMDSFDLICYIIDLDSDELVYLNKEGREAFGLLPDDTSYIGKKCYHFFKGYHFQCEDCKRNNIKLLKNDTHKIIKEINFRLNGKNYFLTSRIVPYEGKNVRLCIAVNVSENIKYIDDLTSSLSLEKTLISCIETLIEDVNINEAIINLLSIVGEFYFSDRAYIFEINSDEGTAVNTYEWSRSPNLATIEDNPVMQIEDLQYILHAFDEKGELFIDDIYTRLNKDTPLYDLLHETDTRSLLLAPLYSKQQVVYFIGVDNPQRMTDDLTLLHSISIFISDDIKKRKLLEKLEKLSYNDVLTGVYNRNKYVARLNEIDTDELKSLGVIHVDANSLKKINEMYGVEHGDKMIKKIAEILLSFSPDELYRLGGDEFVALYFDIEQKEFEDIAQNIRKRYSINSDLPFALGSMWQNKNINIPRAVTQSGEIMLVEKQNYYKNNVCKVIQPRSNPLEILLSEIENGDFTVYLQAKVLLATGKIAGAEALVRKFDANKKLISPDNFIPMYEHDGTIIHLDFFVFEEVCKILQKLIEQNKALKIAVNFSRITFMSYDLVDEMINICAKYSLPHEYIRVEITESIEKMNFEFFAKKLNELKDAGFELSLDDFGAKYSNLLMLSMPAFTEVKIDKGLIDNIEHSSDNSIIVKNIIRTIKDLGRSNCVAEGIENSAQVQKLIEFGCVYGQGYFYHKPVPVEDFLLAYEKERT